MPNITSNTAPDRAWLLTPPGPGAIAVIRWSGVEAVRILASHFSQSLQVGRCVHGELRDESGAVIDDPIVVLQDDRTADINLHGGGAIVRAIMSLAQRSGLAIEPPPLDRLIGDDVIEQEVHAALPLARTRFGLATLLAQPRAWKNTIWTDEQIARTLADRSLHWLLYPPTITIIGIPNAGKSTLANRLFGQDRSIVFDQPGTTRDWVGEFADVDGLPVMLIDTPGMRATTDPIEAIAIHRSRENVEAADLVILVLDLTQPERDQVALCSEFRQAFQLINKSDLPPRWQPEYLNAHRVVATRGEGVADLRAAIRGHFLGDNGPSSQPLIWTTRQRVFLERIKPVTA